MITKNQSDIWADFLTYIEEKCTSIEFQNWIAPIQVDKNETEELVLKVPNIFVQEYLLENYTKDLASFVPMKANGHLAIRFVIVEEIKKSGYIEPTISSFHDHLKLNPLYTLENFIEGPSNQFVKSAALGIATHPGQSYNPFFIHGGPGLGKTHILHGIGHLLKKHHKKLKIQCTTTEGFINDIVNNLKNKSMDRMKNYYRSLDVLLVDDIQFLQSRLNFEDEFCNTFESLLNQNKQIVITCDKLPSQLRLSERLIGRMEWGLVAHLGVPDLETRVAILQHKAELRGIRLPHKIALFIAEHIYNNVRQLEGAINRLSAYSRIIGKEITEDIVQNTLGELLYSRPQKSVSIDHILQGVSAIFEVRVSDLKGTSRLKQVAFPRQVAMYLAKELLTDSLMKLALVFGGKTHSTLIHAWKKIGMLLQKDESLRRQIDIVRKNLENERN